MPFRTGYDTFYCLVCGNKYKTSKEAEICEYAHKLGKIVKEYGKEEQDNRMNDLISRQAAIDAIDKILPVNPMKTEYTQGITCGAALAMEYVKQLPPADVQEMKWIPLESPITDEQWKKIADTDFEHTDRIWFETEHGKVEFVKAPAQPKQRWIPVNERLPEEGHDVLITKEPFKIKGCEHEVIKAKRSVDPRSGKIEWWSPEFGALTNKAVLAWMPLPEPYQEEQDG